jgi:hypothetical protein
VSPWWWGSGYPYGYGYYPYSYGYGYGYGYPAYSYSYPYPAYAYPSVPYAAEDQVYVQRPSDEGERPIGYWYYCESKRGYYPRVAECPEEWVKVPASAE